MIGHGIAPLHGTSVTYSFIDEYSVLLLKDGYNFITAPMKTFNELYFTIDSNRAALKTDCIQYVIFSRRRPLYTYPEWYVMAFYEEMIYHDGYASDEWLHYDSDTGEEYIIHEGSFVLLNARGRLKTMYADDFVKYYEL